MAAGEVRRLPFADLGEVVIYCPQCAEREFDEIVALFSRSRPCPGRRRVGDDKQSETVNRGNECQALDLEEER